jgi:hypothetical protein
MPGEGDDDPRAEGGGPSGAREGGGGSAPAIPGLGGPDAECPPIGMIGGGGSVDAGLACAGAQCDVEGGGTWVPGVTNGNAEIGGAEVLTDEGGGGTDPNGDEGGGGAERECACALGGGGTDLACGGGGTDAGLRPGGGGTVRPGGDAELPGFAEGGGIVALRGRVSDSKMSSASMTEGRDAPLLVAGVRGVGTGSEGARSIHSANSLDSRPCLAASMKHVSLLS